MILRLAYGEEKPTRVSLEVAVEELSGSGYFDAATARDALLSGEQCVGAEATYASEEAV
jgi:hypothetical protein